MILTQLISTVTSEMLEDSSTRHNQVIDRQRLSNRVGKVMAADVRILN
jgi:hypothetical protein